MCYSETEQLIGTDVLYQSGICLTQVSSICRSTGSSALITQIHARGYGEEGIGKVQYLDRGLKSS